jgi:hypothetical protein
MSRCLLSRIHQLGVLIDVEDTPNLVISTLSHPFARASPKTSGQQLWLRKSADTSSHQRYLPDPPRLSTSVLDRPPPSDSKLLFWHPQRHWRWRRGVRHRLVSHPIRPETIIPNLHLRPQSCLLKPFIGF